MNNNLNPKQKRFVNEYLLDLNATAAAERAGYSDPNYGRQLLTDSNVSKAITQRRYNLSRSLEINQERVLNEEKCIAFFDPRGIVNSDGSPVAFQGLPGEVARAISAIDIIEIFDRDGNKAVKYKYRFWDKGKALERLSKHLGLYNESIVMKMDDAVKTLLDILPDDLREKLIVKLSEKAKEQTNKEIICQ